MQQGCRAVYREAHALIEEIADGTRRALLADLAPMPRQIIDDLGIRKLPHTAAEDPLQVITAAHPCRSGHMACEHDATCPPS